jgi:signal transduction histidine kinase
VLRDRFGELAAMFPQAMLLVAADGLVLSANPAARALLADAGGSGEACRLTDLVADAPETILAYLRMCARARQMLPGSLTLRRAGRAETVRYRVQGALLSMRSEPEESAIVLMLEAAAGSPSRFALLTEKIDRHTAEVARRRIAERERLLVREHAARLAAESARAEAEDANRTKDEFLAMLGHELRNPLAPIRTALDLMRLDPGSDEAVRAVLERQVGHMVRLVDDLLDVSRIAQGKVELDKRRVEIAVAAAKAVEMASPMLEQLEQHLTVSVPAGGLAVDGDVTRLAQVISNLLANASKYTGRGGRITLTAEAAGGEVALRVADTGIGITAEMLPRVFDMFTQERQALDRSQGGLGLGLAIVHNLTTAHGGTVHAHSDGLGRGSTFTLRLPAARDGGGDAPAEAPPQPVSSAGAGAGLPILVVDDNTDAATLLALYLRRLGHSVRVAHDGPSAIDALADFAPQVAFLDLGLPVMDGFALARRLRETPGLARLHLVALTGYGQDADRRRSKDAGFDVHLVKPAGRDALKELLAAFVAGRR